MFWVMYHVDQPGNHTDYPLIMWLQGGPGASGVGYGNFMELGPYDINGNLRDYAWTKKANVMFVDNPVGAGYSYVDDSSQLTTDNAMIANDLVTLIKTVFTAHPEMQVMPFYVFAESYGGKMTVDFALLFDQAIKNGEVVSDFRGVALGDSWISPMDSVNTWGTFLYQMGFVNQNGLQAIDNAAADAQASVDAGLWEEATNKWSYAELVVMIHANNVNFYNVLAKDDIYKSTKETNPVDLSFMSPAIRRLYDNHVAYQTRDALGDFMNGAQADNWGIPSGVVWDSQGGMVFDTLAGDFMKPVIDSVVRLLTETNLDVVVFTGDLDLICDTPGTYRWIENMEWPDKPNFMAADNSPIYITEYSSQAATLQKSGKLSLYTLFRSGHMVPIDAPEMSLKMLDMIFANSKESNPQYKTTKHEQVAKAKMAEEAPKEEAVHQEQPKHEKSKKEAPAQHAIPKVAKLVDLKEEAFKEEAEKEKKEGKVKEEGSEEEVKETKQEEHEKEEPEKQDEEHKQEAKQKSPKMEKASKKQTQKEHKQEHKKKQEQNKPPKVENIKEKVAKKVKQHQENTPKQEHKQKAPKEEHKREPQKQEHKQEKEAPKQKHKQEAQKQEAPKQKHKQEASKQKQKQETPKQEHEQEAPKQEHKQEAPKQEHKQESPKQEHKEAKKDGPLKDVNKYKAKVMAAHQQQQQQRGQQRRHYPGPLPDIRRTRR